MKKLKELIFWITFIIYEELLFSILIFNKLSNSALLIILLSLPIAIFLNIITSISKRKLNIIIAYILTTAICFIVATQLIYYKIYDAIVSIYSIINGGQVAGFITTILEKMAQNWIGLILIFSPLILLIILHLTKVLTFERNTSKKEIIIKAINVIAIYTLGILCINNTKTEGIYSNKNLYYNIHAPKVTANRMGLFTTMKLDLKRLILGFEENIPIETISLATETIEEETEYNVTNIDFQKLIENEQDETIVEMHKYFVEQIPTEKNEYTGMFEGKNLVVFVAEALSNVAIREDITPNLYKLYNEGFQFENFYTPLFPVSTADGEYITDTSLIPKEGVWSIYKVNGNYMPYSYPNVFENLGYSSNSYHNHTATYYHRDKYLSTLGYNEYLAVGTGLEDRMNTKHWPNSDYEMIEVTTKDYIDNEKFLAYYMTVSGHLNYTTTGNNIASKNWDIVKDLPYSEKAKSYLATQIELDKAIGKLIDELEKAGKLEDTVIVISPDHYPYGLTLDELNELSEYERDNQFEKHRTPFLIWSASMEEPIKVEKVCSSLDVLPTILNLFGAEYDSRLLMGNDILSNNKEQIVIFSDRSFITEKGRYNSITGEFKLNEGEEIEENYVEKVNQIIYQKYKMSALVLDKNYYSSLKEYTYNT